MGGSNGQTMISIPSESGAYKVVKIPSEAGVGGQNSFGTRWQWQTPLLHSANFASVHSSDLSCIQNCFQTSATSTFGLKLNGSKLCLAELFL